MALSAPRCQGIKISISRKKGEGKEDERRQGEGSEERGRVSAHMSQLWTARGGGGGREG